MRAGWRMRSWAVLRFFTRQQGGSIAPLIALMAVPVVGAFAIASETVSWWTYQRAQQNAADSAVIAAGIKGSTTEGTTIAGKYGFTSGAHVTVDSVTATCPSNVPKLVSGTTCYQVTVTQVVPLYLAQVVGFREGNTVYTGTAPGKTITASAIAGTISSTSAYCIGANDKIVMHGGGSAGSNAFQGCSMIAATSMNCTGNNAAGGVLYGVSPQNPPNGNGVCGTPSSAASYSDPYSSRVTSAISKMASCGSTQAGGNMTTITQGGMNCYSGLVTIPSTGITVTGGNTIIKVSDGGLIVNGPIKTSGSGTLTIVITGTQTAGKIMQFGTGGALDIASPSSGDWDNIVIAVDPNLAAGDHCVSDASGTAKCDRDISASGNTTINVAGLIYDPNGTIQLNGAISKASSSTDTCILMWAKDIVGNGNEYYGVPAPGKDCYSRDNGTPTLSVVALLQ